MIIKKRKMPVKAALKAVLCRMWLNSLAVLPGALALGLVAAMVVMSVLALADLACTDPRHYLAVSQ